MDTLNMVLRVPGLHFRKATTGELLILAALSVFIFGVVWSGRYIVVTTEYREKIEASRLAQQAQKVIKQEHVALGYSINKEQDPNQTGLIGFEDSIITTSYGQLSDKQTSTDPNMAAVVVQLLREAGVKSGDTIAVGQTSSFPALNIALLSAAHVMQVRPVVITSMGSSNWGANNPNFTWLDMESLLVEKKIFQNKSVAVSLGGQGDVARDLPQAGVDTLLSIAALNDLSLIYENTVVASIERRMKLYLEKFDDKNIAAYVNIGGGLVSVGRNSGLDTLSPGLNKPEDVAVNKEDSVAVRMAARGVPVIHLERIEALAKKHGLPLRPVPLPIPGSGEIYDNKYFKLVGSAIGIIILLATLFTVRKRMGGIL